MNIMAAVRTPVDDLNEVVSELTGLDCSKLPDLCRQEERYKTDINYQLTQFGLNPFGPRIPQFGTVDFNMDTQNALNAAAEARTAFKRLAPNLRQKYPTWIDLLAAAQAGELDKIDLLTGEPKPVTQPPNPTPPAPTTTA